MHFKILLGFTIAILFAFKLNGQDSLSHPLVKQFGLDATFVNNFLPLDNDIGRSSPYLFYYRIQKESDRFLQMALNIDIEGMFDNNEIDPSQNSRKVSINYKIGKFKSKPIFHKASLIFGFNYLTAFRNESDTVTDKDPTTGGELGKNSTELYSISLGYGPQIGFEYSLNKKFSLYTEAGFYLSGNFQLEKGNSSTIPAQDFTDKTISFSEIFRLPRTIILFYKF